MLPSHEKIVSIMSKIATTMEMHKELEEKRGSDKN